MQGELRRGEQNVRLEAGASRRRGGWGGSSDEMRVAGARIRAVRRARGLTQEQLADATGVSRSAVAQWETGRAGCGARLRNIASALDVPLRELQAGARGDVGPAPADESRLSSTEQEMVRLVRALEADDQTLLLQLARRLATPSLLGLPSSGSGADRRVVRSIR